MCCKKINGTSIVSRISSEVILHDALIVSGGEMGFMKQKSYLAEEWGS